MLLTTDSVFLLLLTAAQRKEIPFRDSQPQRSASRGQRRRCLHPTLFILPQSPSTWVVLKLLDNFYDEKSLSSKALFTLQKKTIRKAEETLEDSASPSSGRRPDQSATSSCQAVTGRELSHYSEVTEEVTSRVFAHTATLAGMAGNYDHLAQVGRHAARIAYLVDSYAIFRVIAPEAYSTHSIMPFNLRRV